MLRTLIVTPVFLAMLALAWMYETYGEADPCRALAVARARHAAHDSRLPIEDAAETWTRLSTSQMSTGACVRGLASSWWERR